MANKLKPRFSSPDNVFSKSTKFVPKDLLDDEPEEDLSPLDLAMDINELVNLGSEGSDSQGKLSENIRLSH